jgi:hypothetical protein
VNVDGGVSDWSGRLFLLTCVRAELLGPGVVRATGRAEVVSERVREAEGPTELDALAGIPCC